MSSKKGDEFDLKSWAERRGIPQSPGRAKIVGDMLGVTSHHARRMIDGEKMPGKTIRLLAEKIELLAKAEAEIARHRDKAAKGAIADLQEMNEEASMSGDELLELTRGDSQ